MSERVRIIAADPPGDLLGPETPLLFGMQIGKTVPDFERALSTTVFNIEIDVVRDKHGAIDFRGPAVQGRKGDRFLYLSWGFANSDEPFEMFARAKPKLGEIEPSMIDEWIARSSVLVCDIKATNDKGQPTSGTIRAPDAVWRLVSD